MEAIRQPPTEAKRYEMTRKMSRTLISSLLFSFETFVDDCNHFTRYK